MELIPILSTIILVATISTFLLAIGAYILYKVRERRGEGVVLQQPKEVEAELVIPGEAGQEKQPQAKRIIPKPYVVPPQTIPSYQKQTITTEQSFRQDVIPGQPIFTPKPQPYSAYEHLQRDISAEQRKQNEKTDLTEKTQGSQPDIEEKFQRAKFLKYTSEGYIPAKEDKETGALRWR